MNSIKRVTLFILFGLLFIPTVTYAVDISLLADTPLINTNSTLEISVVVDTGDEVINTIGGSIVFNPNLLSVIDVRNGNSIINFWVEPPKTKDDRVTFSGIIPGGYEGDDGFILSVVIKPKQNGTQSIALEDIEIFLNDGLATRAQVVAYSFIITASPDGPLVDSNIAVDDVPPELFTPFITSDPDIFRGRYFVVFATQDKGSGIDYYEIREEGEETVVAESPYRLKNQQLDVSIEISAIDKMGNRRSVVIPATNTPSLYRNTIILAILLILFALGVLAKWYFEKHGTKI